MYIVKEKDNFLCKKKEHFISRAQFRHHFFLLFLFKLVKMKNDSIQPNVHRKSDSDLKNSLIVIFDLRDRNCDYVIWINEKSFARLVIIDLDQVFVRHALSQTFDIIRIFRFVRINKTICHTDFNLIHIDTFLS